ncbi:HAD family hydrolase [Halopiger aswanensis]|uniref:Putative hydrolase of the HAD superfamily n=1 Tax=Halopiger aswanensis TaxID=148449 RepID=A0A419WGU9_9EURY|nr:HAD-IA family hydrolase [Halopiger aswanensis]RKD94699.1 putative hydrolase of the HAD superfamily [Halopiger aswanensis]
MSSARAGDADVEAICFGLDGTLCTETQPTATGLESESDASTAGVRRQYPGEQQEEPVPAGDGGWAIADERKAIRDRTSVAPVPGARAVLETLSDEYRLGVVTNGAPDLQRAKLEAAGLDGYVETVVCGGYETPAKPAPEPFDVALEELDSSPDRAVHVGHSLSPDVAGARSAGLRSVWIPRTGGESAPKQPEPTPAYTLESLRALTTPPW